MAEVLGRRKCGEKIKVVTELLKMNKKANHSGTTVAVTLRGEDWSGGDEDTCYWKNDGNSTWKELQQDESHEARRDSRS